MAHTREISTHNLPLKCPHCTHGAVSLLVMSLSLVTVRCTNCTHAWSVEIARLPQVVRTPLDAWCAIGPPI